MLTKRITDDDNFISLSSSAQALYLHLSLSADDDGFCNQVNSAMFKAHASVQDLEALLAKRYLYQFDNGVIVIKHWRMANALRKDRYTPTAFQEELARLDIKENGAYTLKDNVVADWLPDGCHLVATGKDRVDKSKVDKYLYSLPLKDGTEYEVSETYVDELKAAYPGKDLDNEFNRMRAWLISNPSKQKTSRGIKRFVNGWLSREDKPKTEYEEVRPSWQTDEWLEEWNSKL